MNTENWTQLEYKLFVLLYAAGTDAVIWDDEMDFLEEKSSKEMLKSLKKFSESLSDFECIEILQSQRERFYPGESGKQNLLEEIRMLFMSDGKFSQLEHVIYSNLERIM